MMCDSQSVVAQLDIVILHTIVLRTESLDSGATVQRLAFRNLKQTVWVLLGVFERTDV